MFLTVHATTGIIISQQTGNIWLGFLAGFISHFILDTIPHGDQNLVKDRHNITSTEKRLIRNLGLADTLIMVFTVVSLYLAGFISYPALALAGVVGSILPDYINAFYIFFKVRLLKWYFNFHFALHFIWRGYTLNFRQGLVVQALFLLTTFLILFIF
jgi:hypothetical protein